MLDFGALPPEINSARMYMGPGSSSFPVAASAWNGLAAELQSAAQGYETTITQLASDNWTGPASAAMASAAQPYVTWMQETAAQAEQAATQAQAAAAAYEQAFAATVAPPLVAANRAETAAAVQANVFGQYTALIAQLEAQYGQMWAQDAAAMYGYAGQSASATQVTPFATPAATTTGRNGDSILCGRRATANSAARARQSILSAADLVADGPAAKPRVAGGHLGGHYHDAVSKLFALIFGTTILPTNFRRLSATTRRTPACSTTLRVCLTSALVWATSAFRLRRARKCWAGLPSRCCPEHSTARVASEPRWAVVLLAPARPHSVSAISGGGGSIGKLAVPASWVGGAPQAGPHGVQMVSNVSAAPEAAAGNGNLIGGMPLAGTKAGFGNGLGPRYGFKPTVMPRPPSAG